MSVTVGRPPSRILMTTDAVGGVFTYAMDLARGLSQQGVRVSLAVMGPDLAPDQLQEASRVSGLDLIVTGLTLDWMADDPSLITVAGEAIARMARRTGADLVHLNSPALAAARPFSCPVVGAAHSCLATWWAAAGQGAMPHDFRWRTNVLTRGYQACDAVIAPSAAFADDTAQRYGVARPVVVYNGRRPPAAPTASARERCVITGGRLWDRAKNIAALDEVASRLDVQVFAAGPLRGPGGDEAKLAHITPLGRLSHPMMAAALSRAPIFASLALYEPFGLTVLEAAQAGCALVLSDIPTFRELWSDAAVLAAPNDPAAAARAIQALVDDPAETARLGAVARRRATQFTPEAMTAGTLAVYGSVLAPAEEAVA